MSVKLGLYDFFSYLIPGGIVTAWFFFVLNKHFGLAMDWKNFSITELLLLGILSYLVGYAADFITSKTWYKLFRNKNLFESTMSDFNNRHPTIEVEFNEMDWYISYSFVKKHNLEMAQDIDKFNVTNKMLRTSSFGFLLFAILFLVEFFLNRYASIDAILSVSCFIIAIILVHQAVKFSTWFYQAVFDSLIAIVAKPEQMPITFKPKKKKPKINRG